MKIDGPNPVRQSSGAKKKDAASKAGSADFFTLLSPESTQAPSADQPLSGIEPSTSLDALLTLQEIPDTERREKEAFKHSEVAIDTLEKLRHALLMGSIPTHLLGELQDAVREQQAQVSDPHLKRLMQDIELRAAVELAKLERTSG